jgi:hypothetical protein
MTVLHQVPSAIAVVALSVGATTALLSDSHTAIWVAVIGALALVGVQIVIAISASRNAKWAREAAKDAAMAATNAAAKAEQTGAKVETIKNTVDGWRTAALREIEYLREAQALAHPDSLRAQQQAEDAKKNADLQAEATRRGQKLDATDRPVVKS